MSKRDAIRESLIVKHKTGKTAPVFSLSTAFHVSPVRQGSGCPEQSRRTRFTFHAFSLIELIVTLAIIGMLTVTILPLLGKYGRTNNVVISGQSIREALYEARSDAIAPDPTTCVVLSGQTITHPINSYAVFLPAPSAAGTTNTPVYDPNPGGTQTTYECGGLGMTTAGKALTTNQFAIMARSLTTDATGAVTAEYNVGIVRVGTLDGSTVANVPIVGAASKPSILGFKSPSGGYFGSAIVGNNYIPSSGSGDKIAATPSGTKTTLAAADKLYNVVGVADQFPNPTYQLTIFISNATGQVTSNGSTPSGFN